MKKLMMLILAFVSWGIFAQESTGVNNVINDENNYAHVDFEIASLEEINLVSTKGNEASLYDHTAYSSKTYLDARSGKLAKDKRVLIKKSLIEDSGSLMHKGMLTFSKDRKTVFFSVNRKIKNIKSINGDVIETKRAVNLQLFKARVNENGEWVDLEMLAFNSPRHSNGQPYLNTDDTKLYFVSDGPESMGRTDIFVVDLYKDGTYGKPENLGPKINSSEREILPFINQDNILYFSSDIQNKKGDLDVFASKIFDNSITTPVKLAVNMNTEKTDFTYDIYENEELNSFSFKEQSGKGVEELYATIDATDLKFNCQQKISGIVKNADTQELLSNVKITLYDANEEVLSSILSNESDASFSFKQSCNTTYTLKGYLEGYLIGELEIKTVNDLNAEPLELVMNMKSDQSDDIVSGGLNHVNGVETNTEVTVKEDAMLGSSYNFKSAQEVYTVQIGAFEGYAETDKYIELSSLFNYQYADGLNRYYSGVFASHEEAMNYLNLLKLNGFKDAFVVRLKGESRF